MKKFNEKLNKSVKGTKQAINTIMLSSLLLNPSITQANTLEQKLIEKKELSKEFIEKSSKNQIFLSEFINEEKQNPITKYLTKKGELNSTFFITDSALYQIWSPKNINLEKNQKFILRESPISNNIINFENSKIYIDANLSQPDITKYSTKKGILEKTEKGITHSFHYEKIGYKSASKEKEKYKKFLNSNTINTNHKLNLINLSNIVGTTYRDSLIFEDDKQARRRFFDIINKLYNSYPKNKIQQKQSENKFLNLDSLIHLLPQEIYEEPKIETKMFPQSTQINLEKKEQSQEEPIYLPKLPNIKILPTLKINEQPISIDESFNFNEHKGEPVDEIPKPNIKILPTLKINEQLISIDESFNFNEHKGEPVDEKPKEDFTKKITQGFELKLEDYFLQTSNQKISQNIKDSIKQETIEKQINKINEQIIKMTGIKMNSLEQKIAEAYLNLETQEIGKKQKNWGVMKNINKEQFYKHFQEIVKKIEQGEKYKNISLEKNLNKKNEGEIILRFKGKGKDYRLSIRRTNNYVNDKNQYIINFIQEHKKNNFKAGNLIFFPREDGIVTRTFNKKIFENDVTSNTFDDTDFRAEEKGTQVLFHDSQLRLDNFFKYLDENNLYDVNFKWEEYQAPEEDEIIYHISRKRLDKIAKMNAREELRKILLEKNKQIKKEIEKEIEKSRKIYTYNDLMSQKGDALKTKERIELRKAQYNKMIELYKGEHDNFNQENPNTQLEQGYLMTQMGGIKEYYKEISKNISNTKGLKTYSKSKGNLEEKVIVLNTPAGKDSIIFTKEYIPEVKKHLYLTKIHSYNEKNKTMISLEDTQGNGSFNYIQTKQGSHNLQNGPLPEKYKIDLKENLPNQKEEYLDPKFQFELKLFELKEILKNEQK